MAAVSRSAQESSSLNLDRIFASPSLCSLEASPIVFVEDCLGPLCDRPPFLEEDLCLVSASPPSLRLLSLFSPCALEWSLRPFFFAGCPAFSFWTLDRLPVELSLCSCTIMEQLTAASIQSAIDPSELLGKGGTSWVFQVQKTGLKVVGLGGNEEPLREDGQPEAALKVAWETGHMPWEEILKEGRVLGDIFSKTSSDFVLRALGWGVGKASEILPEEVRRAMRLREKTGEDDPLLVCLLLEKMSYDASQAIAAARRPWDHAQASGPKLTECLKGCRERVLAMLRLAEGGQTTHDARYVNQDIKSQNLLLLV
eukprot:Cvel_10231.t1-p1 / transcript=Cvel_10231.t1 / gene=Cvel_10231 / organism=Chromera_velia_CCMP2878 / gene_product=hypothetical protein / transcript_product=hypothetical protein / location=Cvel_scaffold613:1-3265(-) / protein_length=311 / sequence_SO=supercontig / SO=protein_coding / is_pseudo=false